MSLTERIVHKNQINAMTLDYQTFDDKRVCPHIRPRRHSRPYLHSQSRTPLALVTVVGQRLVLELRQLGEHTDGAGNARARADCAVDRALQGSAAQEDELEFAMVDPSASKGTQDVYGPYTGSSAHLSLAERRRSRLREECGGEGYRLSSSEAFAMKQRTNARDHDAPLSPS